MRVLESVLNSLRKTNVLSKMSVAKTDNEAVLRSMIIKI